MSIIDINTSWFLGILMAVTLSLGFAANASADIAKVNSHLQRAETNLQSVAASVAKRTTPPTGGAAKLLISRLQQAIDDLTPAKALLEKVPAGTAGREEAVARYEAANKEYDRLREFMTGSAAAPPATTAGTRLDYKQEEVLSGARFNLREVEGGANQLTAALEKLRAVEDQLSIDFREVAGLLSVVENAKRKSGFVKTALDQLPDDGTGVPEVRQQLVNADAKVVTATDFLNPLNEKLQKLIDPAQYPEFQADHKRLSELSRMFADPMIFQYNRALAATTYQQADAAKAECTRIAQEYARLMAQRTDQGRAIEGEGNGFLSNLKDFLAEADVQKKALPEAIRKDLNMANGYATEAVAEQKPMWFTGGIPQVMASAQERVELLTVLDEASGKEMQAEFDAAQKQLKAQADSLRELIIRENKLPLDAYKGEDREATIKVALSGWKIQQDKAEVLMVRIPSENWARETSWSYSNGTWYFSDRSKLQVRLIVADHENPELVIDRPVTVWKDHQKGDSMIGVPLRDFKDKLQPNDYLLKSRVKKP